MTDDDTARLRERTQQHVDFHMEMVYAAPRDILALLDALDEARRERDAAVALLRTIKPILVTVREGSVPLDAPLASLIAEIDALDGAKGK